MLGLWLGLLLTTTTPRTPQGWKVVLSRGPLPMMQDGRVVTAPGTFVKWLIADRCLVSLGSDTAAVFSPEAGSACPRVHLIEGTIRIVAPVDAPIGLSWTGGVRTVTGVFTARVTGGRLLQVGTPPAEPAPEASLLPSGQPAWSIQTRLTALLRETFSGSGDTLVQGGASGSMCLDSGGSAGDVGNHQSGITQMPPTATLRLRVPYPRTERAR